MSRIAKVLVVLLALPSLASAQSLEGVWRMTQVTRIGGPNPGVIVLVRTNLLIYTESHFMWVFDRFQPNDPNQDPRPLPPAGGELSDADIGRTMRGFSANSGTYLRDGSTLTYNALASSNPTMALPENQPQIRTIRQLTPYLLETQSTGADGTTTVLTYTRVE